MKNIKVLGPGCKRCETTAQMVRDEAARLGVNVQVEKVTDYGEIADYGIASTPGIVIDGKVVHAGGLPKSEDLTRAFLFLTESKTHYIFLFYRIFSD